MGIDDIDLTKVKPEDMQRLLSEMNDTLAQHTEFLEKHYASMEDLRLAIKELDGTIKNLMKTEQLSLQLRQALVAFVEQHINPIYYQCETYTALPSPPHARQHRLTRGHHPQSSN
jgi:hypothetical protein